MSVRAPRWGTLLALSWGPLGPSWGPLGAFLGRPGSVLGRSWGPSWSVGKPRRREQRSVKHQRNIHK
eukprot:6992073-Pyramimonas_sp.AAC.1